MASTLTLQPTASGAALHSTSSAWGSFGLIGLVLPKTNWSTRSREVSTLVSWLERANWKSQVVALTEAVLPSQLPVSRWLSSPAAAHCAQRALAQSKAARRVFRAAWAAVAPPVCNTRQERAPDIITPRFRSAAGMFAVLASAWAR